MRSRRSTRTVATRVVVVTGAGDRAFAAGADIVELADQTPERLHAEGQFAAWDRIGAIGMPLIAAVRGFALGGGCELAMTCDLIVAGDDARFGQPEIRHRGDARSRGTQRLTRAVGSALAMELILTGRAMPAAEATQPGLVTKVVPAAETVEAALDARRHASPRCRRWRSVPPNVPCSRPPSCR